MPKLLYTNREGQGHGTLQGWGTLTLAWSGQKPAHSRSFKTHNLPSTPRKVPGAQCAPRKLPTSDLPARHRPRAVSSGSKRSLREPPHLPGPGLRASAPPAAAAFRCTRALSQSRARPPPAAAVRLAPGRGRGTFALLLPARGRRRQRHRGHEL